MTEPLRLNRNSHVPLYFQLKEILRGRIRSNVYQDQQMLPSESELVETFSVSRYVARQALAELEREGLIVSRRGVGSFVNVRRYTKQLSILGSFTQSLAAVADKSEVTVIGCNEVVPDMHILDALGLPPNSATIVVERLGTIDGEPIAVTKAHFPGDIGRIFLDLDLANKSLYGLLKKKFGIEPFRAEWLLSVVPASLAQAELLAIRDGSPLICNRGTTFTEQDRPIEYSELCYRSDRIEFSIAGFTRGTASSVMQVDM
jgi:GntR family transcriptional regulator